MYSVTVSGESLVELRKQLVAKATELGWKHTDGRSSDSKRQKQSEVMKRKWAALTPDEREAHIKRMNEGRRAAKESRERMAGDDGLHLKNWAALARAIEEAK